VFGTVEIVVLEEVAREKCVHKTHKPQEPIKILGRMRVTSYQDLRECVGVPIEVSKM
jgi:hypothetical protein